MNIRKHWKKVILSCAAAFWASCNDGESCTKPDSFENNPNDNEHSNNPQSFSSNIFVQQSSSGTFEGSSSSDIERTAPLYGIYQVSSSSKNEPLLRRANDTTVTCTSHTNHDKIYLSWDSGKPSCDELKQSLENDILSVEEIIEKENDLADCAGYIEATLYGIPPTKDVTKVTYTCSNGEILKGMYGGNSVVKDGLLYTDDEYLEAFPPSSSSLENSSSSESSRVVENQGCNKTDFISKEDAIAEISKEIEIKQDSIAKENGASEKFLNCISYSIYKEELMDGSRGFIAKTEKCPDGTTGENEKFSDFKKRVEKKYDNNFESCEQYYPFPNSSVNLIKETKNSEVGDKFIADGDTCEVVSTYDNWFGGATGQNAGSSEGIEEISKKIDSLTKDNSLDKEKINCLEDIKTMLDRGVAIYGPMPENYPQEYKCSDGIVKETEHYKERLKAYNEGKEHGYKETLESGNKMIDECKK